MFLGFVLLGLGIYRGSVYFFGVLFVREVWRFGVLVIVVGVFE